MNGIKAKTGIGRLDELLRGGIPLQSNILVYGPPFIGKDVLLNRFALTGLKEGIPAIFVMTDKSFSNVRNEMEGINKSFLEYEEEDLIRYVDAYSTSIGIEEKNPYVQYVDSLVNLDGISTAINKAQRDLAKKSGSHRMVFQSISTPIIYKDIREVFRFLQVICGECKMAGATSLFSMEEGMHEYSEVQTMKHLMDGVIEFSEEDLRMRLRVQGCSAITRNWIEYEYEKDHDEIRITGAFKMGRIA